MAQGTVDERIGLLEREMLLRADRRVAERRLRARQRDGDAERDPEVDGGDSSGSADPDATLVAGDHSSRAAVRGLMGAGSEHRKSSQTDVRSTSPPDANFLESRPGGSRIDLEDEDDEYADADERLRNNHVPTLPPYVDARPTIRTYFKIYSPAKVVVQFQSELGMEEQHTYAR
ncbi:hypothetical protein H2203_000490 [Taxawa tesnikishii (nom. ined.)]|nr:hypothetical protein H2203_000490 [Dothideales sp. JES 119]